MKKKVYNLNKRKGIVKLSNHFIDHPNNQILKEFFSNFYPTNIEHDLNDILVYHGLSPLFSEVKPNETVPEYVGIFTRTKTGIEKFVKFEKINNT